MITQRWPDYVSFSFSLPSDSYPTVSSSPLLLLLQLQLHITYSTCGRSHWPLYCVRIIIRFDSSTSRVKTTRDHVMCFWVVVCLAVVVRRFRNVSIIRHHFLLHDQRSLLGSFSYTSLDGGGGGVLYNARARWRSFFFCVCVSTEASALQGDEE